MYAAAVPTLGQQENKAEHGAIRTYPKQLFEVVREAMASSCKDLFLLGLPHVFELFFSCCSVREVGF